MNAAKKILIVEDDVNLCLALKEFLGARGYVVTIATDAYNGFRTAVDTKPDVIILDMQMPAGGGQALFQRLVANESTKITPVIFSTSLSIEELDTLIPRHPNARAYLRKPPDLDELLGKLRALLKE